MTTDPTNDSINVKTHKRTAMTASISSGHYTLQH